MVIPDAVAEAGFRRALGAILARPEVEAITSCLRTL